MTNRKVEDMLREKLVTLLIKPSRYLKQEELTGQEKTEFLKILIDIEEAVTRELNQFTELEDDILLSEYNYRNFNCVKPSRRQIDALHWFIDDINTNNIKIAYHHFVEYVENYEKGSLKALSGFELQLILVIILIFRKLI